MGRACLVLAFAAAVCGCSSFFEDRVAEHDERIAALRAELESARGEWMEEERAAIVAEIEAEEARRDEALEGVHREGGMRQALLMAVISLLAGGLKIAGGIAGRGAGG